MRMRSIIPLFLFILLLMPSIGQAGITDFENFTTEQSTTMPVTSQLTAYAEIDVMSYNSGQCNFGVVSITLVKTCTTDAKVISNVDMTVTFTPTRLDRFVNATHHYLNTQYILAQGGNPFDIADPEVDPAAGSTTQNATLVGIVYQITGEVDPYIVAQHPAGTYSATVTIAVTPIP